MGEAFVTGCGAACRLLQVYKGPKAKSSLNFSFSSLPTFFICKREAFCGASPQPLAHPSAVASSPLAHHLDQKILAP